MSSQLGNYHPSQPQKVSLCLFLPVHPLHIPTHLYIIQHPAEALFLTTVTNPNLQKRALHPWLTGPAGESQVSQTVPLLAACLPHDRCKVNGHGFSEERDPELSRVCQKSGTLLLYPGAEAANLEEFVLESPIYPSIGIVINGTWSQAKDTFYKNSLFPLPKRVQLKMSISSQYVVWVQPPHRFLSTLECAAVALSILEKNNYIQDICMSLEVYALSFQLQRSAQICLSKKHLLKNALYPKPMPKNQHKLRKMELLMNSVKI
ncbi:LOW QUALITY PROTEIN: tRNA-uridine aminocarboxypropyltransferase 2 [Glossophaga mutica]